MWGGARKLRAKTPQGLGSQNPTVVLNCRIVVASDVDISSFSHHEGLLVAHSRSTAATNCPAAVTSALCRKSAKLFPMSALDPPKWLLDHASCYLTGRLRAVCVLTFGFATPRSCQQSQDRVSTLLPQLPSSFMCSFRDMPPAGGERNSSSSMLVSTGVSDLFRPQSRTPWLSHAATAWTTDSLTLRLLVKA